MDILSLPIELDEKRVDSRFRLVILAKERCRQLLTGTRPVIEAPYTKETTLALLEILTTDVEYLTGREARRALREARLRKELEPPAPLAKDQAKVDEVRSELEKDLNVYVPEPQPGIQETGPEEGVSTGEEE